MEAGRIDIIPSKSFAHRAYICDLLAGGDGESVIARLDSDDIEATRNCVKALKEGKEELDARESGSTLRFILPLAGALGRNAAIKTRGRLSERPMAPLENALRSHGLCIIHEEGGVIKSSGILTPGDFELPGSVSSQFITGLLLVLPYLRGSSRIILTSALQSKAYVDITLSVLADYGVSINEHDNVYEIPGGQKYEHNGPYVVEGDWSQAAFWLAAGLISDHPVSVAGLRPDSVQGDRRITEVLEKMGGAIRISRDEKGVYVYTSHPSKLRGITVDISEIPDLAPAIAAAACMADGTTRLVNAGRLRLKESDRIESIITAASQLGFRAYSENDEIVIEGAGGRPSAGDECNPYEVETANDHRIVMMAAVLSRAAGIEAVIKGRNAVTKSYPGFFDDLEKAGF